MCVFCEDRISCCCCCCCCCVVVNTRSTKWPKERVCCRRTPPDVCDEIFLNHGAFSLSLHYYPIALRVLSTIVILVSPVVIFVYIGLQVRFQSARVCSSVCYCTNSRGSDSALSTGGTYSLYCSLPSDLRIFLLLHPRLLKTTIVNLFGLCRCGHHTHETTPIQYG